MSTILQKQEEVNTEATSFPGIIEKRSGNEVKYRGGLNMGARRTF